MADFVRFGTAFGFGYPILADGNSGVLQFDASTQTEGLLLKPNTGATGAIKNWTLAFDLYIPGGQNTYAGLIQTDITNASDADIFIKALSLTTGGIGISSNYPGTFDYNSWERVVITAEASGTSTILRKYIDGVAVGTQTLSGTRWQISDTNGVLLLTDNDGETASGAVSSIMFADSTLTATQVAALGTAKADGISAVALSANATEFDFTGFSYAATYGPGVLSAPGDTDPPALTIAHHVSDVMRTPGSTVTIDLSGVFNRSDVTLSIANDDPTVVTSAAITGTTLTLQLGALGHADLLLTATDAQGNTATDNFRVRVAGEHAYTIAVLPDTQDYSDSSLTNGPPQTFYDMTQWLVDNKASHNIVFVSHVGDITQHNLASEWVVANTALSKLDGVIPYSVLPGNHDMAAGGSAADHSSGLDTTFSPERQAASNPTTFGGVYDQELDRGVNNWQTFTAPDGTKWLVLSLEFGPRDDVIRWAGEVIESHLDYRVMLVSHALTSFAGRQDPTAASLYDEGAGYDYGIGRDSEGANDGETIYRELLARYPNITLTFSGHIFGDGAETDISYSQYGTPIVQSLVNYQNGISREITGNGNEALGNQGGNGAMRLVVIDPDNNTISTETYFTEFDDYLDGFRVTPELNRDGLTGLYRGQEEVFTDIDVGTPELHSVADAGDDAVAAADTGLRHAVVTLDGSRTLDPARDVATRVWFDADGHAIAAGSIAEATLGTGRHHLTLAVTDRAGGVSTDQSLVLVTDAGTRLVETFNDGTADGWVPPGGGVALQVGTPESFGLPALVGGAESVVQIPALSPTKGLLLQPNFGYPAGSLLPTWSIVFDILVPAGQGNSYTSLLQLDTGNASDGDLFIRSNGDGTGGIGISGDYPGSFQFGVWQRVAFTFTPNGADTLLLSKYIEGALVGTQTVSAARHSLDIGSGALLFSDEDGETAQVYASSMLITDHVFTGAEIAALGGAKAGGILATPPSSGSVQFDFNDASLAATYGAPTLSFGDIGAGGGNFLVKGSVFSRPTASDGHDAPEARIYEQSDSENNVLVWGNETALGWTDYTLEANIRSTDNDSIGLVFYWQDIRNHYRVVLDGESNTRSLIRVQDGVATVLATEVGGTHFNVDQELEVSIGGGRINVLLDGRSLFGGPVTDVAPLPGGTVGLWSSNQRSSEFDNITVNDLRLEAHAGADLRVADLDGDGTASVALDGGASFGLAAITAWRWTDERGEVLSTEKAPVLDLGAGRHELTLTVTDANGAVATDEVRVEVVAKARVLLAEDFSGGSIPVNWTIVDEGEFGGIGPDGTSSDWAVVDGVLVQRSDLASRQLEWDGATNADYWLRGWSPLGDGVNVLRVGTYALYTGRGSADWTDYSIEATIRTPDNDGLGFLIHYVDPKNYYKLELDAEGTYDRDPSNGAGPTFNLVRMHDGIEEILGQVPQRYTPGESFRLRLDIQSGKMTAFINGDEIFAYAIEDHSLAKGTVALYSWGNAGLTFDDVQVIALDAAPGPYAPGNFTVTSGGSTSLESVLLLDGSPDGLVYRGEGSVGGEEILGTGSADAILGLAGDDTLRGAGGADSPEGGVGNDLLVGAEGNDTLSGGVGRDVAVFASDRAATTLTRNADGSWTAVGPDGTDRLAGVEVARFADGDAALASVARDFTGSGTSDILFRAAGGGLALWQMQGLTGEGGGSLADPGAAWSVAGLGDFDGDRRTDILWRGADGTVALWRMDGTTYLGGGTIAKVATDWQIAGVADFNGDGRSDILWRHADGSLAQWWMDGTAGLGGGTFARVDTAWSVVATADFDGDGHADLLWRHTDGRLALWRMAGTTPLDGASLGQVDVSWSVAGTGDFNGDGRADILWRNADGRIAQWWMDGLTGIGGGTFAAPDAAWKVGAVADFDGDGKADILWRNDDGSLGIWEMDGLAIKDAAGLGNPGTAWSVL